MKKFWKNNLYSQKGFSLLEILIAVGILATSFVALLSLQGSAFLSSERAQQISQATFLARQKMAEIEIELEQDMAKSKFPDDAHEEGEFKEPFEDFRWKYVLQKVEIPVASGGLPEGTNSMVESYVKNIGDELSKSVREVKLTIYWGDKEKPLNEQQNLTVTTHVVNLLDQAPVASAP